MGKQNLRSSDRHRVTLPVEYPGRRGYQVDWTQDISESGTFLRTHEDYAVGDSLVLAIAFPGMAERILVEGEVVRVRGKDEEGPRGVGVRFDLAPWTTRLASLVPVSLDEDTGLAQGPYAELMSIPRVRLGQFPTPLHRADRLTEVLGGPEIWFKRDDLTSFALGGNKVRKLEYLAADALAKGADSLVTGARGAQSNHVRITMGVAAHLGLDGFAVIHGPRGESPTGNLLLDELFDAQILSPRPEDGSDIDDTILAAVERLRASGRAPYAIPLGGATQLGTIGYVAAALEMAAQLRRFCVEPDRVVCATGSCGTHAGLFVGNEWSSSPSYRLTGISISRPSLDCRQRVARLARDAAGRLGLSLDIDADDVEVLDDYIGGGYGVPTPEAKEAIGLVARTEGIVLDPVYTGKSMAGLIDLIRKGQIGADETVVFLHSGGWPALFA